MTIASRISRCRATRLTTRSRRTSRSRQARGGRFARACEGIKGTSCRFAGRASPGARSGAWQGRATDEQQRVARPAKRPCGPALCVRPTALLTARVALLPSFAAPCGTSARGRQDAPFIPSQALTSHQGLRGGGPRTTRRDQGRHRRPGRSRRAASTAFAATCLSAVSLSCAVWQHEVRGRHDVDGRKRRSASERRFRVRTSGNRCACPCHHIRRIPGNSSKALSALTNCPPSCLAVAPMIRSHGSRFGHSNKAAV